MQKFVYKDKVKVENLQDFCAKTKKSLDQNSINHYTIMKRNIKKRYKKLVKIFHPDVNDDNKNAERKFKEITEAYKILLKKFLRNE